jgi:hypothetical protein
LSADERLNYRLGRRAGYYDSLDDLNNNLKRMKIDETIKAINAEPDGNVEKVINDLKSGFN